MKAQARLGLALSWRWITSAFLIDVAVLILASHLPGAPQTVAWWVVNRLTGRQLAAVRASLPSPAKRPPLVVPARTLREDEQLTLRVGPTEADAAPQHSMRPAEASDDAQRAAAVDAPNADGRVADRTSARRHSRERIVAATTAQPPLPPVPDGARPVGAAAAIVEDDDGGRVYVRGNLAYAWDAGDAAGRRFAAVSLTRIKAATHLQVAAAFAVKPATLRRWETRCSDAGVAGLLTERKGPKRKSKLTPKSSPAVSAKRLRFGARQLLALGGGGDFGEPVADNRQA
jgi:hypothetical protein